MDNTQEMYLRSKYKYLLKSISNNVNRGISVLTPAEEKKRLKELKKLEMQKLCQPGKNAEKKGQFKGPVEEVVNNVTPIGEKKGKLLNN